MIIQNGTIEFKAKTAGGIDPETGYPTAATAGWSEPIPCQWLPKSSNLLARILGERFEQAAYEVLLEEQPLPDSEQVRLTDANGESIGEFSLRSRPERLEAVGLIRLMF